MIRRPFRAVAVVAAAVLVAAGCSSSGSGAKSSPGTSPTSSPTTTAASPAPYVKEGPYAVGFTTLHLAGGRRVVVWYPAQPGGARATRRRRSTSAGMLSPSLQKLIPPSDRVLYKGNAFAAYPPVATDRWVSARDLQSRLRRISRAIGDAHDAPRVVGLRGGRARSRRAIARRPARHRRQRRTEVERCHGAQRHAHTRRRRVELGRSVARPRQPGSDRRRRPLGGRRRGI